MLFTHVIREYYRVLEGHDYEAIMAFFSKDAHIVHPIFGVVPAAEFFKILLERAKSHKITIINMLQAIEQPNRMATYLSAKFMTKDNVEFEEEAVHIYDFYPDGLINKLTVIIDTYPFRKDYEG